MLRSFVLSLLLACASAASASDAPALDFRFDFELARASSRAVLAGTVDAASAAEIARLPATAAMVRKMKLADSAAFIAYLRHIAGKPAYVERARLVQAEFAKAGGGTFGASAAEVRRQIQAYVPAAMAARLNVYFVFGGTAAGFAFDDNLDDVYVDLSRFTLATAEELAETVSHELFHGLQSHLMTAPPRPAAGMAQAATGKVWASRLLYDLLQEGSAELFTHGLATRPATPFSGKGLQRIERNGRRMQSIFTLYETSLLRLLLAPPASEGDYDAVYGVLFTTDFDELGYDMGWVMANAIERADGKEAIVRLLQQPPKQFVLRYAALAKGDADAPQFSEEFLRTVRSL